MRFNHKGFTIVELVVVTLFIGLLVFFLRPAVREIRRKARINLCRENLRQISIALRLYASEHEEKFPNELKELRGGGYVNGDKVFDCLSTTRIGTIENSDYNYVSGLNLMSPSGLVLVEDKAGNHKGQGRNVLYVSGDIEWVD